MARVERANVVLHVKDDEVPRYLSLGYKQTDENGNLIQEAVPHDVAALTRAYIDNKKKIAELETQIADLTQQLEESKRVSPAATVEPEKKTRKKRGE